MTDLDVSSLAYEWFHQAEKYQSIETFLTQKYLQIHGGTATENVEQEIIFRRQLSQWQKIDAEFGLDYKEYPKQAELTEWQAVEMLENVMRCFNMTQAQKWKYLLNVRLACDNQMADKLCGFYRISLDQAYDDAIKSATQSIQEHQIEEMLAQTVAAMRRTRLAYDDETRAILANLNLNPDVPLPSGLSANTAKDIRLISNFVVAEMVQTDQEAYFSPAERQLMVEQVVPTCVSATMVSNQENDDGRAIMLAQAKLGATAVGDSVKLMTMIGVTILAAKVALKIVCAGIAMIGIATTIASVYGLWKICKDTIKNNHDEKTRIDINDFADTIFKENCAEEAGELKVDYEGTDVI